METKKELTKLLKIQLELKVTKDQKNNFGGYKYRSCEDIMEGVKPLLKSLDVVLQLNDELVNIGDRYYIKAEASLFELDGTLIARNYGYAREEESKKGMDGSQITGASSSYARKYALNGLFLIDDNKDSDATNDGSGTIAKSSSTKPINSMYEIKLELAVKKLEQEAEGLDLDELKNRLDHAKKLTKDYKELNDRVLKLFELLPD